MESSRIIQGTETRSLPVALSEMEKIEYARQLAQEVAKYDLIETDKKDTTARLGKMLKEQRATLDDIAERVNTGREYREVEVEILFDFQQKMVEVKRTDTYDLVEKRPMTKVEYQAHMQTRAQYGEDEEPY